MEPTPMWWETRREPVQLALEIPIGPESTSPKPPKVRRSCMFATMGIVIRILGLILAVVTIAYAAWTFYQIPNNLTLEPVVEVVAQGAFLLFIGGLALLAELRTRWTMRGCINTYILFASYLARGIVYIALGAILWALKWYEPPVAIKQWWVGAGIIAIGVLNLLYYPFHWKYHRALDNYNAHPIPLEPYPEEIIYGMDTLYIKNNQAALSPAVVEGGRRLEGANEISPPLKEKSEKETPGGPEQIHIVVEPSIIPNTTSATTTTTCAEEIRRSTNVTTVVETIPVESIGVGAS